MLRTGRGTRSRHQEQALGAGEGCSPTRPTQHSDQGSDQGSDQDSDQAHRTITLLSGWQGREHVHLCSTRASHPS
jgi:hypothetical protein